MTINEQFVSAEGKARRMIAIRLSRGTDLVQGLIDACKKHGVRSGGICSMIGSLAAGSQYVAIALDPNAKTGAGFTDRITIESPVEVLSGQGVICDRGDDLYVHLHCVTVDINGTVRGGHVERGYCQAMNTLEIVILEGEDVVFRREYDEATGYTVAMPRSLSST